MSTLIIPWKLERPLPPFEGGDIRYPEGLVRHFIKTHTKTGDRVFDPFAGHGTTLFVAEDMRRIPYGMEADEQRHAWAAGQLDHWQNMRLGDSAAMGRMNFPKMDFCMTSPPFMPKRDKWNPLYAGNPKFAGYDRYLTRLETIFTCLKPIMKRGAKLVVQVDNLTRGNVFTPLVRDMGTAISQSFTQIDEHIILWKTPRPGYDHTTCLVFTA
jgi:tRNA G10  N-methylase Trm11